MHSEYVGKQKQYHSTRKSQLNKFFSFISQYVSLQGGKLASLGCGTAPEAELLSNNFKHIDCVDQDAAVIDFCLHHNAVPNAKFIHQISNIYLDKQPDCSIDCILALDIDTNLIPQNTIELAKRKLRSNGLLILTERENNIAIYGRLLLYPFIAQLRQLYSDDFAFRMLVNLHESPVPGERDNIVLIMKKR